MRGTAELSGVSVRLQQSLQGVHTGHLPDSCRLLCIRIQGITSATGKSYRQITRTIFSSRWCASVSQEKRLYSVEYVYMCFFGGQIRVRARSGKRFDHFYLILWFLHFISVLINKY